GASNSQHLYGRAVDIRPSSPASLAKFEGFLDRYWFGALGYGARRGFIHIDTRNGKGWRSGGEKGPRWDY
ncbi:D-Ala-D-Ala carboxypeptidase family metallohydrolase, partial [Microcystis aeruginosa]|uniref:D-Ala-D-Ala carboxypeptidase family metallohydrolase n=1 Tax=Microcystis aeruginosa TaxID=1126 RepID=UPI00124F6BE1